MCPTARLMRSKIEGEHLAGRVGHRRRKQRAGDAIPTKRLVDDDILDVIPKPRDVTMRDQETEADDRVLDARDVHAGWRLEK